MDAPTQMKNKALEIMPELDNEHLSLKASLVVTLIEKISNGDMKAFELMRDTIGEKPVEKQEVTNNDVYIPTLYITAKDCANPDVIREKLKNASGHPIKFISQEECDKVHRHIKEVIGD